MNRSNSSLAYDFSYFEESSAKKVVQKKEESVKKTSSTKKSATSFLSILKYIFCVAFIVSIFGGLLVNYVKLTESTAKITSLKRELTKLEEQEALLNVYIERKTNVRQVEEYAKEKLGMSEVQSHQIEYVSLENKDKVQVLKTESENSKGLLSIIAKNLNIFAEYLWQ